MAGIDLVIEVWKIADVAASDGPGWPPLRALAGPS
jgi:hypothetical protein